jgi:hypothetical protein
MLILSVDEAGSFLATARTELLLGHLRGDAADLPFLADVGPRHARLERALTFRDGVVWRVVPLDGERVLVAGEPVPDGGRVLVDGDRVQLGVNLAFRFRRPDAGSTSAVLDLQHGAECRGCGGVLLFGEGPEGRVRIGPGPRTHVRAAALEHELVAELAGGELSFSSTGGVSRGARAASEDRISLAVPPREPVDLFVGSSRDGEPPFAIALRAGPG